VIVPWLGYVWVTEYFSKSSKKKLKSFISDRLWIIKYGFLAVLVGIAIFFIGWPYLWLDPVARVGTVFEFYKVIGTTSGSDTRFLGPGGVNIYPIIWIVFTTPPVTLALFFVGFFALIYRILFKKDVNSAMFLAWLGVPIARAVWPGATTYGGVRQLMEYIPAFAVIAGVGAVWLRDSVTRFKPFGRGVISLTIILLALVPISWRLYQIHPNENVYFNFLIGGLSGARDRDMPNWGMNFGAAYRQGVVWLNENAPEGANIVFAHELLPNIPRIWLRTDLNYHNIYRSGYLREGEYAITLIYRGTQNRSYYDMYLEEFIKPSFAVDVDGVPIMKVWRNSDDDLKYTPQEKVDEEVSYEVLDSGLRFDLGEERRLSRLVIQYDDSDCMPLKVGYDSISNDGLSWVRIPEVLPNDWRIAALQEQPKDGNFIEPFSGQIARYVDFNLSPVDTCLKNVLSFKFYYFDDKI